MKKSKRMSKNHTRAWRAFAALLVVALAAIFLSSDFLSTEASNRFPGVDTIISRVNANDSAYTILELEPDAGLGQIGYYVKDGEYNYLTALMEAKMAGNTMTADSAARSGYFTEIRNSLINEGICSPDSSTAAEAALYPISGGSYSETFFLSSSDTASDWHRMTLPNSVSFEIKGTFAASSGNNTGDYDLVAGSVTGFEAVSAPTGAYDVTFVTNVTDTTSEAYKNAAKYGAYSLQTDGAYLKISNQYASSTDYYVDTITESSAKVGGYNAIGSYTFNTNGTGAYNFTRDDTKSVNVVPVQKVYYKANFTNNELLKKDVFGITNDVEYPNFKISVTSLTESQISESAMTAGSIPDFDMFYISGDTSKSGKTYASVRTAGLSAGKTEASYMDFTRLQTLLGKIFETSGATGSRSCIIDYSIFDNISVETINGSSVYKLAAALLRDDVKSAYETDLKGQTESAVNWDTIWSSAGNNPTAVNHNYAKDNVYCWYNTAKVTGASADTSRNLVSNKLVDHFSDTSLISGGFQSVLDLIDSENTIRSYTDPLEKYVSQARAIQYIINSWNPRKTDIKTTINILEVEPSASYDLTQDTVKVWAADLINKAKSAGASDITFNITQMTSAEFIGKINDLNTTYDMIYFGMNTGKMNVNATTKRTVYNDTNMNGLVYSHNGDYVFCADEIAGMLNRDYVGGSMSNYLYSESLSYSGKTYAYGSTSTQYSYNRSLNQFTVKSNAATIKLKNAMTNVSDFSTTMKDVGVYRYSGNDINGFKLDDLIDYVKGRYAVVVDSRAYTISDNQIESVDDSYIDNSSNMYTFLDTVKGYDNVITYNVSANKLSNQAKFESYLNMNKPQLNVTDQSNGKSLSFALDITSNVETDANTKYSLSFYADINTDGQYSVKEEITDGILTTTSGETVAKDANGRYLLESNVQYVYTKSLGDSFVGYIPYKLEISNSNPEYSSIRSSWTGNATITGDETQKQTINILQIMQKSTATGYRVGNFNMQTQQSSANSTFRKLLNGVSEYNINITSIPSDTYVTYFNNAALKGENYLDNYNMVVMGFADVYLDIDNNVTSGAKLQLSPLGGILKFIQDGKSVLFTHDTTSFVNVPSSNQLNYTNNISGKSSQTNTNVDYWGYNINSVLRSVVGMDRFGATGASKSLLDVGDVLYFGSGTAQTGTKSADKNAITANDYSYVANSAKQFASGEVQGFTNNILNSKKLGSSTYYSVLNTLPESPNGNGAYDGQMWASQVNTGQITEYPYKINENIKLAKTHYQYYQLDLDADDNGDGKSDIVVWYTIAGVTSSSATTINSQNQTDSIYQNSPNDVRNNYYIYSKGNVMYSGVGHSSVASSEDELKLYINTIIAAYKNGAQAPVPTIRDNSSITSSKKSNEYITYDDAIAAASGSLDKDLTLYYSVEDPNLIAGDKKISVEYYMENANSDTTIPGTGAKGDKLDLTTYAAGTSSAVASDGLASGNMYQITIPNAYSYLGSDSTKKIYVVLTSDFDYYGKSVSLQGYDTLTLVRQQLFNLN